MAWRRTGGWGPPQATREMQGMWEGAVRAALPAGHLAVERRATCAEADQAKLQALTEIHLPTRAQLRGIGPALYRQTWRRIHGAAFEAWCRRRSDGRRYLRLDGREWRLFAQATSFTQAFHVFRVLAN
eukprot:3622864-Alexandrium_andersonii.AAC.1